MTLANNRCPGDSQNQFEYPKAVVINAGARNQAKSMHIQANIQSRQNNATQRTAVHAGRHCSTMQKKKTSQSCRAPRQASDNPQSQQRRLAIQAKTERAAKEGQLFQQSRIEEPAKIQLRIKTQLSHEE
ncbi:hypothetical protein Peur_004574 [Populus x canadensis]